MSNSVDLSVIIPAYNSQKHIKLVINRVVNILKEEKLNFEVLCVTDGCDDNTQQIAEKESDKYPKKVFVLGYKKNRGKGYAVRFGMKKAKGKIVGFIDADYEIYPDSIIDLLEIMKENNADIVVGSKRNRYSKINYPLVRRLISFSYYCFVKILFNFPVTDTQAGMKLYKKHVIDKILPLLVTDGFAFDVEILERARKAGFTKIYDGPILVDSGYSSGASVFHSFGIINESIKMFADTLRLFFRLKSE